MSEKSFKIPPHWWGKIIGAVLGLFRGGISGAVVGALLGHFVDRFFAGIVGVGATQKVFFDALFATLGHLSKADGVVTQTEVRMVESLMQRMQISGDDRQRAIRLFNQGKQADFDLEKTLQAFAQKSMVRQDLRQGKRLNALAPPPIPHKPFMRENCVACHSGPAAREEIRT